MTGEHVVRRLAAILAADIVGYSQLMERDRNGMVARLDALRSGHLEPALARHRGRLVRLGGNGALVEFASALEALCAAIEFQQAMAEANRDQPAETAIVFRIGMHVGDLIVDGDDLHGDGVSIAARLEAAAPPGGIVVSGAVHDAVERRGEAVFHDIGALTLENVAHPIRGFRVEWHPEIWRPVAPTASTPAGAADAWHAVRAPGPRFVPGEARTNRHSGFPEAGKRDS